MVRSPSVWLKMLKAATKVVCRADMLPRIGTQFDYKRMSIWPVGSRRPYGPLGNEHAFVRANLEERSL